MGAKCCNDVCRNIGPNGHRNYLICAPIIEEKSPNHEESPDHYDEDISENIMRNSIVKFTTKKPYEHEQNIIKEVSFDKEISHFSKVPSQFLKEISGAPQEFKIVSQENQNSSENIQEKKEIRSPNILFKLSTETHIIENMNEKKNARNSYDFKERINCSFSDIDLSKQNARKNYLQTIKNNNYIIPEIKPKNTDISRKSDNSDQKHSKNNINSILKAGTDMVISFEKKIIVGMQPSHFRREKKSPFNEKYEILDAIGKGAYGEVKTVKDKDTGTIKAVKIMPKASCQMTRNFVDEIKILQKLDHPNVLRLYEFFQDDNDFYLITEYCGGGDLLKKIEDDIFYPETSVAWVMKQIFAAVEYCHRHKVVHRYFSSKIIEQKNRDLKPENIVFTGDSIMSTLKIIDFGRSRIVSQKEEFKDLAGSLYYMAPEVLASKPYNEKCDYWSCGVLMYLLLSGFPPFYGHSREEIIASAMAGDVQFSHPNWKKVSSDAKKLILQLLNYDPSKRLTAAQALHHPWVAKHDTHESVTVADLRRVFTNLRNFKVQLVFQQTVLSYLASQQMQFEEENNIRKIFTYLDKDKDGQLSKNDLIQGFSKVVNDKARMIKDIDMIMKNTDIDHNMLIDYNEFLVANLHIESALTKENLTRAFEFFDEVFLF